MLVPLCEREMFKFPGYPALVDDQAGSFSPDNARLYAGPGHIAD